MLRQRCQCCNCSCGCWCWCGCRRWCIIPVDSQHMRLEVGIIQKCLLAQRAPREAVISATLSRPLVSLLWLRRAVRGRWQHLSCRQRPSKLLRSGKIRRLLWCRGRRHVHDKFHPNAVQIRSSGQWTCAIAEAGLGGGFRRFGIVWARCEHRKISQGV